MNPSTEVGGPQSSVNRGPAGQLPSGMVGEGDEAPGSLGQGHCKPWVPGRGAKLHSVLNYWFHFSAVRWHEITVVLMSLSLSLKGCCATCAP